MDFLRSHQEKLPVEGKEGLSSDIAGLDFGDLQVAPFRRSHPYSISVITRWPDFGDHGLALYHRSITLISGRFYNSKDRNKEAALIQKTQK
jgi:hypothetical protein